MSDPVKAQPTRGENRARARAAARLAAVQALYQMELSGVDINQVLAQYGADGAVCDGGEALAAADFSHFKAVLRGVLDHQVRIDRAINAALAQGWSLGRLDATLRAILRSGAFELIVRRDIPFKVVINEYVDVARAFFDSDEPGVVNGVLDKLAAERGRDSSRENDMKNVPE